MSRAKKHKIIFSPTDFLNMLENVNAAAVELRVQHDRYMALRAGIVQATGSADSAHDVTKWYVSWGLIGIRRLVDESRDAISLVNVMCYMASPTNSVKFVLGEPIDRSDVNAELKKLRKASKHFVFLASKGLAHAVSDITSEELSLTTLDEVIEQILSLSMKYMAGITGKTLGYRHGQQLPILLAGTHDVAAFMATKWKLEPTIPQVKD